MATTAVARVVFLVGLLAAYLSIAGTGRLDALESYLEESAPINVDDPETLAGLQRSPVREPGAQPSPFESALEPVLTPEFLAIVGATLLLGFLVLFVVDAVISAGQLHAVYATLRGAPATRSGVAGVGRHGSTFVGLVFAEGVAYVAVFGALSVLSNVAGPLVLLAGLLVLVLIAVIRLVFAFARPAAVVDSLRLGGAIRAGYDHVTGHPGGSLVYGAIATALLFGATIVGSLVGGPGTGTASSLVLVLVVLPILDATKLVLYAEPGGTTLRPPQVPEVAVSTRLKGALVDGVRAVGAFVRGHPVHVVVSLLVFAGGVLLGVRLGAAIDHIFVASIEQRLALVGPGDALLGYATNNSAVGASLAFSGFALGVPTLVSLAFNGANLGLLYQLEADPATLVAFVVPHGVVELPALVIAGALGLHLGVVAWRALFGSVGRRRVADAVDEAFRVVVGLAVLFGVAAVIEAFVSPYYWRLLGI